jgi:hypothetical protein
MTREQAEWMAQFLGVEIEMLLSDGLTGQASATEGLQGAVQPEAADDLLVLNREDPGSSPSEAESGGEDSSALAGAPIAALPAVPVIVIAGVEYLTRELVADVTIANGTSSTLTLDKAGVRLDKGEIKSGSPKPTLAPNESTHFVAHSASLLGFLKDIPLLGKLLAGVSLGGIDANFKYNVDGSNASWTCHFVVSRIPGVSPESNGVVTGNDET